jgi:hypothetical protein
MRNSGWTRSAGAAVLSLGLIAIVGFAEAAPPRLESPEESLIVQVQAKKKGKVNCSVQCDTQCTGKGRGCAASCLGKCEARK